MNYQESLKYLEDIRERGAKLELEPIQRIIEHLPARFKSPLFIQVAGTNGKGSTSHFITSILQHAGFKTGLFTSPHIEDIRERITINKLWIKESEFADALTRIRTVSDNLLKKGIIDNPPTFFEHLFLTSLQHFETHNADAAIFEVGLGGRLDATTTLSPEISVITNISLDHTKTLGSRLRDIAYEKAGIIKARTPVICGCPVRTVASRVIRGIAAQREAPYHAVFDASHRLSIKQSNGFYRGRYATPMKTYDFNLSLKGRHQAHNAAIAIKAMEILNSRGVPVPESAILEGIQNNFLPARIEIIPTQPRTIIDCSHNVESIKVLAAFLEEEQLRNMTLIFGVLQDKKYQQMLNILKPFYDHFILTEPISNRALPAEKLTRFLSRGRYTIEKNLRRAYAKACMLDRDITITGSLYLAGEMRRIVRGGLNDGYQQIQGN